ncbi:conjugal transfer protein [Sulfurisphaera ohwakuensis]|uniref:conjugal transfer protein n=1 Tax=Sulfurisphaera ohwakuensis TaxID=69656 RepID=UPI0036F2F22C
MERIYHLIKLLLYIAREEGVEVNATKLQKIFFLLEKEGGVDLGLEFKPWFFGPYSSILQDCIEKLVDSGDVDVKEQEIKDMLSNEIIGYKRVYILNSDFSKSENDKKIEEFFRKWVKMSRSDILNYVYKKYPEYGKYSIIKDKILGIFNE